MNIRFGLARTYSLTLIDAAGDTIGTGQMLGDHARLLVTEWEQGHARVMTLTAEAFGGAADRLILSARVAEIAVSEVTR